MLKKSSSIYLIAILSALMVTPAQARTRSFVSSYGNDANPCGPFAPCRQFDRAIDVSDPDGEVVVLDSAGFLPVTISKSVSLTAPTGVYVAISVLTAGTSGITIATPGVNVVLRGLIINGLGGDNGIVMSGIGNLSIENCVISNFSGAGQNAISVNAAVSVRIVDTLIRDNVTGIKLQAGAVTDISGSKFLGNDTGIYTASTSSPFSSTTISDTIVTGGGTGIEAISSGSGSAQVQMIRSSVTNNLTGIKSSASGGTASVTFSESMVTGNVVGYSQGSGGSLISLVNNTIANNGSNTGSLTPLPGGLQ
ncbi:Copper-binding protein (NosD) [Candidatus Nitrotoga sp. BS]|uniref:NosD domain-containing protein n=1 Tax=Candidatus Nitrotoga sp. BS TaxID=2890408 RepID=UPI001EF1EB8C|nr:NosD domain-containing protein [Candidatus Nitrotoga sp. BS]CAH1193070.1 Copper-binding protein (NosD) [Candidatus Nitrotoga sp. BS]